MSSINHSTPSDEAGEIVSSSRYIELATQYAQLRWCWDDASHIQEICEQELSQGSPESPRSLIDGHADDFGLEDPFSTWGSASAAQRERCRALEDQIDALFPKLASSPKP